jgi:hypothetical protein
MTPQKLTAMLMLVATAFAAVQAFAASSSASFDVDPEFRAKIAKEKAKQNATNATNFKFNNGAGPAPDCGSQNIGNVDTGGRIGAAPREVFVFAPNAINLVNGSGCR